jgi:hypothetical protein
MITKLPQSEHDQMYLRCTHIEYILVHGSKRWNLMRPQPISPTNWSCATCKGASSCAGATRAALAERGRREACQGCATRTPRCAARRAGLRATGMDGQAGAAAPRRVSEPGAGARRGRGEGARARAAAGAGRGRAPGWGQGDRAPWPGGRAAARGGRGRPHRAGWGRGPRAPRWTAPGCEPRWLG